MKAPIDLRLARHGAILLLLGMLTGFAIARFHDRGFGDAAHMTGLVGGFGLIALGLLWPKLNLTRAWSGAGAWITAASLYLNWLGIVLKGGLGQGSHAAAGSGSILSWDEAGYWTLKLAVLLSLASTIIILAGLRRLRATAADGQTSLELPAPQT